MPGSWKQFVVCKCRGQQGAGRVGDRSRPGLCMPWLLICAATVATSVSAAEDDPFVVPVGQRQLFLDDRDIEHTVGFQRQLHQPQKKGP